MSCLIKGRQAYLLWPAGNLIFSYLSDPKLKCIGDSAPWQMTTRRVLTLGNYTRWLPGWGSAYSSASGQALKKPTVEIRGCHIMCHTYTKCTYTTQAPRKRFVGKAGVCHHTARFLTLHIPSWSWVIGTQQQSQ